MTDAAGTAFFENVPVGPLTVTTSHLTYLERTDSLDVVAEGRTVVRLAPSDRALELEPITVEVRTPEAEANRRSGSSASLRISQVEIRETIRTARANNVAEVIRASLPNGVRLSPMARGSDYVGICIESSRGGLNFRKSPGVCHMVQVVVDGGYLSTEEGARLVENFPLMDIVSLEFLSPMEPTFRYGTQDATGMRIIGTAR